MERRLGHDFGKVRIHTNEEAGKSAGAVNAVAYTVGNHVAFARGHYSPETQAGQWLLAHELAHVVQQAGASSEHAGGEISPKLELGHAGSRAEQEASQIADSITSSKLGSAVSAVADVKRPVLQRETAEEWDKMYRSLDQSVKSYIQKPYEVFKSGLGDIRPTTKGGLTKNVLRWDDAAVKAMSFYVQQGKLGSPAPPEITMGMLKAIYPGLAADVAEDKTKEKKAQKYLDSLNLAFKAMQIDTVEAQANYLAHAFIESDQFRQFTETQGSMDSSGRPTQLCETVGGRKVCRPNPEAGSPQRWIDKPEDIKLNKSELKKYSETGDVNPKGTAAFIGRGPVQVTHRGEYVEVIATLEKASGVYYDTGLKQIKAAEAQFAVDGNLSAYGRDASIGIELVKMGKMCREAAEAVKADPQQAANPEYAFVFSAAYMKMRGGDVRAAQAPQPDLTKDVDPAFGRDRAARKGEIGAARGKTWTGADPASSWVAGQRQTQKPQVEALAAKGEAYDRIYRILCRESPECSKAAPQAFQQWASKTREQAPASAASP